MFKNKSKTINNSQLDDIHGFVKSISFDLGATESIKSLGEAQSDLALNAFLGILYRK